MSDEIVQGIRRCTICFGELPCRQHPGPPSLSFAGGTHFEPNPNYKNAETPRQPGKGSDEVSSVPDDTRPFVDDVGRPRSNSDVATGAGDAAPPVRQDVRPDVQGAIPLRVKEASERLTGKTTTGDVPPEVVIEEAVKIGLEEVIVLGYTKDGEEYFATSSGDMSGVLWLLERGKFMVMHGHDESNPAG